MNFKVGDKVVFINEEKHLGGHRYYPKPGTSGEIIFVDELCHDVEVQWEIGSTAQDCKWWCHFDDIALVRC